MTKTYAFRLKPGQDLKKEIQSFVNEYNISAGWIATCVGSLTNFALRFANQKEASVASGHFEILSLAGTVSKNGSHLHICMGDTEGNTIGGHLLEGNIIYTTAEIILHATEDWNFTREIDQNTGCKELVVTEK